MCVSMRCTFFVIVLLRVAHRSRTSILAAIGSRCALVLSPPPDGTQARCINAFCHILLAERRYSRRNDAENAITRFTASWRSAGGR